MLPDMLPAGKTSIAIKTRGFPGCERSDAVYEFGISWRNLPFALTIPGRQSGPDNCEPYFEEQEKWLDRLAGSEENGVRRIWDCLWQLDDEAAFEKFLSLLEPFQIESKFS
jgi:hypothetical protein